jgi:hypothetical protein
MGQVVWLKNFILGLRVVDIISRPLTLYCNNKVILFFSHNNKLSGTAKHIELQYLVVRKRIQDCTINLEHMITKKMLAGSLFGFEAQTKKPSW